MQEANERRQRKSSGSSWTRQKASNKIPDDFHTFITDYLKLNFQKLAYQQEYYRKVKQHKHFIVNKSTGSGFTTITLLLMLHAALTWSIQRNQFAYLNGLNMKEGSESLGYLKNMIEEEHPELIKESKVDRLTLINDKYFKVYPADHVDAIRGQRDIQFIAVDEAAFFEARVARHINIRRAIERYIPKTDPWIVWYSTPNGPSGVFYEIWQEATNATTVPNPLDYDYMIVPYTAALPILGTEYIARMQKEKPMTFDQEFNCKFLAPVNAATPIDWIDRATEVYELQ
jgi:hypothetical protein